MDPTEDHHNVEIQWTFYCFLPYDIRVIIYRNKYNIKLINLICDYSFGASEKVKKIFSWSSGLGLYLF